MRSVTDYFKQAAFAQETDEVFVVLVVISHPEMSPPLRLCSNAVNMVSRGNTYYAFPFEISFPADTEKQPVVGRIAIDNVDRTIVQVVRSLTTAPTVDLEIVRASAPDTVEYSSKGLQMRNISYDAYKISADLYYQDLQREPWPQHRLTPGYFPGL